MTSTQVIPALDQLAQSIAGQILSHDDEVKEIIRLALIDSLGCMFIGARADVTRQVITTIEPWGEGDALVIGYNKHLTPPWAALINGVAAHSLDFDDWEFPGNTHPSAVLFPALMAAATGKAISSNNMINAYVAGFEVITRLGEALNFEHYDNGWHATSSLGTIGAAAAVACLLQLDPRQMANAMAISVSMSGGLTRQFGTSTKPLHAGIAAKSGLMAAHLSAQGLTGNTAIMQGERGFNALTSHGDELRFDQAFDKIGHRLAIIEHGIAIKPYPTCSYIHRVIDCAKQIHEQMKTSNSKIISIKANLLDFHAAICPIHYPSNISQAIFSIPYCCALALLGYKIEHNDFSESKLKSKAIKALMDVTKVETRKPKHPEMNFDPQDPDWLEVTDAHGQIWRAESAYPLGSPQNPMSAEQIYQKFKLNSGIAPSNKLLNWIDNENVLHVLEELSNCAN